ncbi:MAG: SRPBCC family protein [Paludibacteraceae bacterium]|nr:SRPBCC family protein [Paludibacteraceae bacterium]
MTTYESKIQMLTCDAATAFGQLSDLRNLEKYKNLIPQDKLQDLEFEEDACRFSVAPVGRVELKIVDREAPKTIKFGAENSPVAFNLWIQLVQLAEGSKMKITLKADLPLMIKTMIGGKLQDAVDKMADAIAHALNK